MKVPKNRFRFSVGVGRGVRYALDAALALYVGRHLLKNLDRFYWEALEPTLIVAGIGLLAWGVVRLRAARNGAQEKLW